MTKGSLKIGVDQRRARLARRHLLAAGGAGTGPDEVARALVALHATDPATVYLATAARLVSPKVDQIEHALYERRSLIRMLGMRRTMFVLPVEVAAAVQAGCTAAIAVTERKRLLDHLRRAGVGGDDAWLADVERSTVAALARRGSATAAQLAADEPRLRTQLLMAEGKKYESVQNITTRVLTLLSANGYIVRGRPRGSWISSQYNWSPIEAWLPGGLPPLDAETARVELARRWLARYGPGTPADLKWWSGWTMAQTRAALSKLDTAPVDLDGAAGVVLADDVDPVAEPEPWVALLPALDPTVMGWVGRDWYLGEHGPVLFDRSGNPGPTVWCDGRIVGGWAQRADGPVAVRLFEDVGRQAAIAIDEAAASLTDWLGPVRVTPRFRTPLEWELSGLG
ncbi:MAG TPA: winged helix DNA-binding domain-containing protein [Micromonosporaceae bacterium]